MRPDAVWTRAVGIPKRYLGILSMQHFKETQTGSVIFQGLSDNSIERRTGDWSRDYNMVFGIIYEYVEKSTGQSAYMGKASSLYSHNKALEAAHRRHLGYGDSVPFDYVLRENESVFSLRIIDALISETGVGLQGVLKPLEKARARKRHPKYNHIRFVH